MDNNLTPKTSAPAPAPITQTEQQSPNKPIIAQEIKDPSEILSDERLFATIGYIPMLFVLPSAFKPKSQFCQKHAKQGMILSVLFFVTLLIMAVIPALGFLLFLGLLALIAMGALKAHSGNEWSMPKLSKIAAMQTIAKNPEITPNQPTPAVQSAPKEPAPQPIQPITPNQTQTPPQSPAK